MERVEKTAGFGDWFDILVVLNRALQVSQKRVMLIVMSIKDNLYEVC